MNNQIQEKVKYCLYARKSTEQDEKQALSIESQIKEMTDIATRDGLDIIEIKNTSDKKELALRSGNYDLLILDSLKKSQIIKINVD